MGIHDGDDDDKLKRLMFGLCKAERAARRVWGRTGWGFGLWSSAGRCSGYCSSSPASRASSVGIFPSASAGLYLSRSALYYSACSLKVAIVLLVCNILQEHHRTNSRGRWHSVSVLNETRSASQLAAVWPDYPIVAAPTALSS